MQNIILLFFISIFLFPNCEMGPGTSGRDKCKHSNKDSLSKPDRTKADKVAECIRIINILSNATRAVQENSYTNTILIQCAIEFTDLKKCNQESPNPWPIPYPEFDSKGI